MNFEQFQLNPKILEAVKACGYKKPTPVQAQSIPCILEGKDVVASAPTGTGKTAAYVLPILHRLALKKASKARVLILTPTRELAGQITDVINKYGRFLHLNIVPIVGGLPYQQQLRALSRSTDIIIATPGRLKDHLDNQGLDLSKVEVLVLDEADRMLDMGFINDVKEIMSSTAKNRQTLLFSATVDNQLMSLVKNFMHQPVKINLSETNNAPDLIKQELYMADSTKHKTNLLMHFLNETNIYKAIIFSATKRNAGKLATHLRDNGHAAAPLHGDLKQSVRNRTLEQLRRGKIQYLVATDVAARGIDVLDISHIINYDLPRCAEDYVHRIGRTGRAGKTGIAISLAVPGDMQHLHSIERYIGSPLERLSIVGLEAVAIAPMAEAAPSRSRSPKGRGGYSRSSRSGGGKSSHGAAPSRRPQRSRRKAS